jgi:hypothetical protein
MMVRIYNTGAGVGRYHTNTALTPTHLHSLILPFQEIINIDVARLLGGAFSCFISHVSRNRPPVGDKWRASVLYEVLLASVGACLFLFCCLCFSSTWCGRCVACTAFVSTRKLDSHPISRTHHTRNSRGCGRTFTRLMRLLSLVSSVSSLLMMSCHQRVTSRHVQSHTTC